MIVVNETEIKWKGFPEHKKHSIYKKKNKSEKSKIPGVFNKTWGRWWYRGEINLR